MKDIPLSFLFYLNKSNLSYFLVWDMGTFHLLSFLEVEECMGVEAR